MVIHEHPKVVPAQLLEKIKILAREEQPSLHSLEKLIQLSCWVLLVRLGCEHPVLKRGRLAHWKLFPCLELSTRISAPISPVPDQEMSISQMLEITQRPQHLIPAQRSKSAPALLTFKSNCMN